MISSLWIAKTGLDAQQTNMDVIANNPQTSVLTVLSVSARCLKICFIKPFASRGTVFRTNHLTLRITNRHGVRPVATERLHSQGNLSQTNNSKDVAIKGQGFFRVMLPDGSSAYTRDGSFGWIRTGSW